MSHCFKRLVDRARDRIWSAQRDSVAHEEARQKSLEIFQELKSEDWSRVRRRFAPLFRWVLTESVLKRGWAFIRVLAGSPVEILGHPIVTSRWLTTVKIPVQFKRAKFAMSLHMLPTGALVGLRFIPYSLAGFGPAWESPTYAKSESFCTQDIHLGEKGNRVEASMTLPKTGGPFPCIILIAGSGPCDKDSTVGAIKPFRDLASGLATQRIAVLRFDKPSYANKRKFFDKGNITFSDEYIDHTRAAVQFCTKHPEILNDRIYLLGHSLGACAAPRVASLEPSVSGCIILAGPGEPYYRSAIRQLTYLASLDDSPNEALDTQITELQGQAALADGLESDSGIKASSLPFGLGPRYWLSLRDCDPIGTTRSLERPVFILQGDRDYQVTVTQDFSKWQSGLAGKEGITFRVYENLNHLFVEGVGPSTPLEYESPGHVDPKVVMDISEWVHKLEEALSHTQH